jgi:AraC-like DNA-binding protein
MAETNNTSFKIHAEDYYQMCHRISKNFLFFERHHLWKEDSIQVDVFGNFWSVALSDAIPHQLTLKSGHHDYDLSGKRFIFIPPFSIIEWRIAKGLFDWRGYISKNTLPDDMPKEPMAFPWNGHYFTQETELFDFIRSSGIGVRINKKETASRVALNIKKWIDSNFQSELRLGDFADKMDVSQAYISKVFKHCYGISPQSYINKIRAFEGMSLLILDEANVGEASTRIGYADASTFHHHFVEEFKTCPSSYKEKLDPKLPLP